MTCPASVPHSSKIFWQHWVWSASSIGTCSPLRSLKVRRLVSTTTDSQWKDGFVDGFVDVLLVLFMLFALETVLVVTVL